MIGTDRGAPALLLILSVCAAALPAAAVAESQTAAVAGVRALTLPQGGSLARLLTGAGVGAEEAEAAAAALRKLTDLRRLQVGTQVTLRLGREQDRTRLLGLTLKLDGDRDLTLAARPGGGFERRAAPKAPDPADAVAARPAATPATAQARPGTPAPAAARPAAGGALIARTVLVGTSLEAGLGQAGLPAAVAEEVREALRYDPRLSERLPKGTTLRVVYQGAAVGRSARLHLAEVTHKGRSHRLYRYEMPSGQVAFVEYDGTGVLPLRLANPVQGARLTSGWGWRIHPVLNREQFHKGIDLAAPRGTPIRAATDGVVEFAGWHGNYGRLLRIRQGDRVAVQYGHLDGFAAGLEEGQRVRRGQVIATVGASGLATGPHLYWEVLIDDRHVNPTAPDLAVPVTLAGADLARFRDQVRSVVD